MLLTLSLMLSLFSIEKHDLPDLEFLVGDLNSYVKIPYKSTDSNITFTLVGSANVQCNQLSDIKTHCVENDLRIKFCDKIMRCTERISFPNTNSTSEITLQGDTLILIPKGRSLRNHTELRESPREELKGTYDGGKRVYWEDTNTTYDYYWEKSGSKCSFVNMGILL